MIKSFLKLLLQNNLRAVHTIGPLFKTQCGYYLLRPA